MLDSSGEAPESDDSQTVSDDPADGPVMPPVPGQPDESHAQNRSSDELEALVGLDVLEALERFFGSTPMEHYSALEEFAQQDVPPQDVYGLSSLDQPQSATVEVRK
jgi:hypothetical protein